MVRIDNPRVTFSLALLMVVALVLPFVGVMGEAPLATDDPVIASATLDMTEARSLSLRLPHEYRLDIPPLYPVTASLVSHASGSVMNSVSALRLTSALFSLGTLVLFYMFALRYGDRSFALLAVAFLATMPGFAFGCAGIAKCPAQNFFLMAFVISIARTFFDNAPQWILLGGVAAAGAFLTCAWAGFLLVAGLWVTGIAWFVTTQKPDLSTGFRYLFFHLAGLLALLVLSGAGLTAQFIGNASPSWSEGFWVPDGAGPPSPSPGEMVLRILALTWPWAPLFCLYAGLTMARALKNRRVPEAPLFLAAWTLSALPPILSGSAEVPPLLPPLALMAAFAFSGRRPAWVNRYVSLWTLLALAILMLIALFPAFQPLTGQIGSDLLRPFVHYGPHTLIAAAGFLLAAFLCLTKPLPLTRAGRLFPVTAILWIALANSPFAVIPMEERMEVQPLITAMKTEAHKGAAAFGVDRRLRASLSFYGHLRLPLLNDQERCYDILKGGDPDFDTLLMQADAEGHLPQPLSMVPVTIVKQLPLQQGGSLLWVKGR